jgi:anti-sigma factor RsiW
MWNDSCRWARERLPLMAGGELVGNDRRKTERHLIGCADCRGRLASLNSSLGVLHAMAAEPSVSNDAPSLWPAIARQIRETRRPEPSFWSQFEFRPFSSAWVPAGIAAGVLLAGGLVASWASSYFAKGVTVGLPSVAAKPFDIPAPAEAAPGEDVGTEVADSRPEFEAPAVSISSPSPAPSRNPIKNGGNGNIGAGVINTSIEATH